VRLLITVAFDMPFFSDAQFLLSGDEKGMGTILTLLTERLLNRHPGVFGWINQCTHRRGLIQPMHLQKKRHENNEQVYQS
jgi:hypothetical protein